MPGRHLAHAWALRARLATRALRATGTPRALPSPPARLALDTTPVTMTLSRLPRPLRTVALCGAAWQVALSWQLYRLRNELQTIDSAARERYGFLVGDYELKYYYWCASPPPGHLCIPSPPRLSLHSLLPGPLCLAPPHTLPVPAAPVLSPLTRRTVARVGLMGGWARAGQGSGGDGAQGRHGRPDLLLQPRLRHPGPCPCTVTVTVPT